MAECITANQQCTSTAKAQQRQAIVHALSLATVGEGRNLTVERMIFRLTQPQIYKSRLPMATLMVEQPLGWQEVNSLQAHYLILNSRSSFRCLMLLQPMSAAINMRSTTLRAIENSTMPAQVVSPGF